jgi:hypothetical protein
MSWPFITEYFDGLVLESSAALKIAVQLRTDDFIKEQNGE